MECEIELLNHRVSIGTVIRQKQELIIESCRYDIWLKFDELYYGQCHHMRRDFNSNRWVRCSVIGNTIKANCLHHRLLKEFEEKYVTRRYDLNVAGYKSTLIKSVEEATYVKCIKEKCFELVSNKEQKIIQKEVNIKWSNEWKPSNFCFKHYQWPAIFNELKERYVNIKNKRHLFHYLWKY